MMLLILAILCMSVAVAQTQGNTDYPFATIVSIQVVGASTPSIDLAHIHYDPTTLEAAIVSYDAPDIGPDTGIARVGIYDKTANSWMSSTSTLSVENFAKGYAPVIMLSLDLGGNIVGVSCKSERIDAGQTRDFGPKVKITKTAKGRTPNLNRPIALSKEGKVEVEIPEKTFIQKYWIMGLGALLVVLMSGGAEK